MQVTTISLCEGLHASNLITQAMEKVSKEGVIIKESRTIEDDIEIMEGLWFDRGFISLYFKFVTDMKRHKVEFGKPFILLSRKNILLLQDILPSLGAEDVDVDWEALVACHLNKLHGQLQIVAVKVPGFIDNRKSILGDLAFVTTRCLPRAAY
jgi:chaperonin GroEL